MSRFDRAITLAQKLITKNGQSVTWRQVSDSALPDPNKPWEPGTPDTTDLTVRIVFLQVKREDRQWMKYLKGTEVEIGSAIGLMAGELGTPTFTPKKKDVVIRDGEQLSINYCDPFKPNDQTVLWYIEFAR